MNPHEPDRTDAAAPDPGSPDPASADPASPDPASPDHGEAPAPMYPGTTGNPFPPFAGGFGQWPDNQYFPQEQSTAARQADGPAGAPEPSAAPETSPEPPGRHSLAAPPPTDPPTPPPAATGSVAPPPAATGLPTPPPAAPPVASPDASPSPQYPGTEHNPFPPFAAGHGPWPDNQYFRQEQSAGQRLLDEQRATAADTADPKRWPMLGAAAVAAVLAVVAPLLTFWDYRLDGSGRTIRYSGWGAITSSGGDTIAKAGHSERYGAALLLAAIVLIVGIVLVLVGRWRLGNLVIALGSAATVALGLIGVTIAEAVGSVDQPGFAEHVGPGVWLLIVGAVLAAVALVLAALRVLAAGRPGAVPHHALPQSGV